MKITAAIMAHPSRKAHAEALALELGEYPFIDVSIAWDRLDFEWGTGKRAMLRGADKAEWHLVIQDDAILTPSFYSNLEGLIASLPTKSLTSLYVGRVRPLPERVNEAVKKAKDGSLLSFYMLLWGVGVIIPSDHIKPMLDFVNDDRYGDTPYDTRVGIFYQRNRLPIYYSMPSLVDHNAGLGSLIANDYDKEPRIAHRIAKKPVAWSGSVIDI